ncbi:MAG TPA: hypothetical protein VG497_17095, partial [Kribbella sp.]|nr:hypothetical protein [Kribbella sp.]
WEDDAIIRDASTGRYVDRDKLHYVDYSAPTFSVKGPSIVTRPPQGYPVTAIFVRTPEALEAAGDAELVLLPASDQVAAQLRALRSSSRRSVSRTSDAAGRTVAITPDDAAGQALVTPGGSAGVVQGGSVGGGPTVGPVVLVSVEVRVRADRVEKLADEISRWIDAGVDGVHLRPSSLELDVPVIAGRLLPELRARGLAGPADRGGSLRGRLGLGRPRNTFSGSAE